MKRYTLFLISILIFTSSCGSFSYIRNMLKVKVTIQEAVDIKELMDKIDNPAFKFQKNRELQKKRVIIKNIIVKDIITSGNVDYSFCIVVAAPSSKGNIDCYVYAGDVDIFPKEDIATIAKLEKNKSKISVEGDFSRFFTLLDDTFTKIEIVNASIDVIGD